jgi:hypothetical protein
MGPSCNTEHAAGELSDMTVSERPPISTFDEWSLYLDGIQSDDDIPRIMVTLYDSVGFTRDALAHAVDASWTWPSSPFTLLPPDRWRELFDYTGYIENSRRIDRDQVHIPTTLYRYSEHTDNGPSRWSWTVSADEAIKFETAFGDEPRKGCIWVAENVRPSQVLAHFTEKQLHHPYGGFENEYVFVADPGQISEHLCQIT